MVSTDLSGIGKASSHPVMVRICLLPEVEVSHSVAKSMAILSKGHSGISIICRDNIEPWLFPVAQHTVSYVFPDILIHAFPVVLMFYSTVCMSSSLVTKCVMSFHKHYVFPCFRYDKHQEVLV